MEKYGVLQPNGLPTNVKIRRTIFELNGDSACGLDGFIGWFYQNCWDIGGGDISDIVHAFIKGSTLPKSISHTNLALLP